MAGLGGDVNYWRTEANGAMYHPLVGKFIGALKFRMGYVDGYGGDVVRLSDRFFEGADTFRASKSRASARAICPAIPV